MSYYTLLDLKKEPFANTPDPAFLYESKIHKYCLQQLELSLELKRGLSVVIGEVGTGKTTLCRKILTNLLQDSRFVVGLILDPSFESNQDFLQEIYFYLANKKAPSNLGVRNLKELIKTELLELYSQKKIPVILIDEGQKIPPEILEIIRELLNFETNEEKLLQVIIFAQKEFLPLIAQKPNFKDRIHLILFLKPLSLKEVKNFLQYRLRVAGADIFTANTLFTWPAIYLLTKHSQGYPRKIIHLAHKSLLQSTIMGKDRVSYKEVATIINREKLKSPNNYKRLIFFIFILIIILLIPLNYYLPQKEKNTTFQDKKEFKKTVENTNSLGTITIQEGYVPVRFLSRIFNLEDIDKIKSLFPLVLKLNPQVDNLNNIFPDTKINIPKVIFTTLDSDMYLNYVYKGEDLEDVFLYSIQNDPLKTKYILLFLQKPGQSNIEFYVIKKDFSFTPDYKVLYLPSKTKIYTNFLKGKKDETNK